MSRFIPGIILRLSLVFMLGMSVACAGSNTGSVVFNHKTTWQIPGLCIPSVLNDGTIVSKPELLLSCSVEYRAYVVDEGWQAWLSDGATAGAIGLSCLVTDLDITLKATNLSGSIEYCIHTQGSGWQAWRADGASSDMTNQTQRADALQIKLTGEAADYFDVYYRVHTANLGWMGWAKNSEPAGTATIGSPIEAFQIVVILKSAPAPEGDGDASWKYTTGDDWLDAQLEIVCAANGYDLETCFYYVAREFYYTEGSLYPTGDWPPLFAREMLEGGTGNCYRFASLFCCLAGYLGYNVRAIAGAVPSYSQGDAPHSWVEIIIADQVYVCDPCFQNGYFGFSWYMITYENSPVEYIH